MRLIDADALMGDCQLAQKQADRHGREFTSAFYSGGGEISTEWWCVEDMIENARTIEERKWIPCSERLPEEMKDVLISSDGLLYIAYLEIIDGEKCWTEVVESLEIHDVDAWMSLPDPYEGGDDNA